ncbi:type VI secretion system-associated protein TagF [Roseateles sp. BYS180W]|uniref:Type VI secretion system-associated protein TagF n=1 Tax=Roseateles rivi TaxID=3299028 RepID=A0ABW7FS32_9BURK
MASTMLHTEPLLYFGKLPSRGDFVRSSRGQGLLNILDRWLSGGIEAMARDPRWKEVYDQSHPMHFAFLGPRNSYGWAGHLLASHDASGRRFPFIVGSRVESSQPSAALAYAPLVLSPLWQGFSHYAQRAQLDPDAAPLLLQYNQAEVEVDLALEPHMQRLNELLQATTVGELQQQLQRDGHVLSLKRTVLALGLLLQPLPSSGQRSLDRGLRLPLPQDPLTRTAVASLWMTMVSSFLQRADFELALFMPQSQAEPAELIVGFDGASARILQAVLDPAFAPEVLIDVRDADWVDEHLGNDYALHKLASYLDQDQLSLQQMMLTFKEVFLGH